ncbi:hypothetical protein PSACC_01215 [Paramicrosporidium saccamoebae]|uniref:Uncharacterized protein n=1 Tax=Paramicrosporidium saccamoebae TaxID=1246581 RepID=A0A2H9TMH1_9FUNG|nr:hypothetical protein PSACC_01215 [Paramicrosporidium saccamoebae]
MVDILLSLQNSQKGHPLQGLLIGTRSSIATGIKVTATKFLPFERFGQHFATLFNLHLCTAQEETVLGWCILLDRECALPRLAAAYFDAFTRHALRVLIANSSGRLVDELVDWLVPLVGLVAVRDTEQTTREFCAFRCENSQERVLATLQEYALTDLDLLSGVDAGSLPYRDELDGVSTMAINELLDQLRAEELETSEGFEEGPKRKTRRRRLSITNECEATSPRRGKMAHVTSVPVEIVSSCPCPLEVETPILLDSLSLDLNIKAKEEYLTNAHQDQQTLITTYEQECKEYELLMLIYKVLSQPDEVILRKMHTIEDYEDRLKKLGAKLRHSLSPEDLLRTLASISS